MLFREILVKTHEAVCRCLIRALLPDNHPMKMVVGDYHGINQEFYFLSSIRNAKNNTFITKQNKKYGHDSLFVGGKTDVQKSITRISDIVNSYIFDAISTKNPSKRKDARCGSFNVKFKSPYSVAIKILTDPEAVETKEIAAFFSKISLMEFHNVNIDLSQDRSGEIENEVKFQDLDQFYTSLEKYIQGRDLKRPVNTIQRYLSEVFSAYDYLVIRSEFDDNVLDEMCGFFENDFKSVSSYISENAEYRRSDGFVSLPSIAELANVIFGIPIAISGFNELLNGGLRQGAGEGTVTLLRGGAGSGKTTLSISIQRAVEALGIPTIFLSSEESLPALKARRESVLNLAQKSHSCFVAEAAKHKIVDTVAEKDVADCDSLGVFDLVQALAEKLELKQRGPSKVGQFARLFLVIDGVHNYIQDEHKNDIRKLINLCRDTNTHVLITSSDEWADSEGIEYFVDNYFSLRTERVNDPMPFIKRGISILKTRHQSSLIGDHFMRFQDEGDLLFAPNFSELLKSHSRHTMYAPDRQKFSRPFSFDDSASILTGGNSQMLSLEHYDKSVTLLYGRGSASKTSLCLRLLASPYENGKDSPKKILVVSFLYPHSYYVHKKNNFMGKLEGALHGKFSRDREVNKNITQEDYLKDRYPHWNEVDLETLTFTPGMITAEEVYSAVSSKIGHPEMGASKYSGILFDGLHNVFVQFPLLEKHHELWSSLINLVRRVGIKAVTTFTDFEVWGARTLTTVDYENVRAKPLLVALSQSIDFGFGLVPVSQVGDSGKKMWQEDLFGQQNDLFRKDAAGLFIFSSFISHGQASPNDYLIWDRTKEEIRIS